jgi:predicted RNA-binding Zn ribbon-like protein
MAEKTATTLSLIGGALCLDFVNTVEDYRSESPYEYLTNFADLASWGHHAGVLTSQLAQELTETAAGRREEAARIYQCAFELRSALYRVFAAQLISRKPRADDLAMLNERLGEALSRGRLKPTEDHYVWYWKSEADDLVQILYPIVRSAADLLTSDRLARLSECVEWGWLFIDMSKNRSRRWCSMGVCGNRAKARRHYQRKHDVES